MQSIKHWHYLTSVSPTSVEECLAVVLKNRQIVDSTTYFNPPPPLELEPSQVGLDTSKLIQAAKLLQTAIEKQQKVVIFGDYDADGVCATAILWEALHEQGLDARPFIPHRMKHGYGLSISALEEICLTEKPDLIVTVDNGIVAHLALGWLAKQNIPVILTDHHQSDGTEPQATVIVHSTLLCGSAVSWFLARKISPIATAAQIDLLGLATLADQMPLVGINRSFAYHGIEALKQTKRAGLLALKKVAQIREPLTNQSVQFGLIPRLNAMGRVAHALSSLRLICVKNAQKAAILATELDQTNQQRQKLTADWLAETVEQAESQSSEKLIVVSSPLFHEGVIGLLAGKLLENLHKPVIALHVGETTAKASVRSVAGFDIIGFLRAQPITFLELGGHALAAGFVIASSDIPAITKALQAAAQTAIATELLTPSLDLECKLPLSCVTPELVSELEKCQPYGQANPTPVFGIESVSVADIRQLGDVGQHLKLAVADEAGHSASIVFWRQGQRATELVIGQKIKVAGRVELNVWRGSTTVQVIGVDFQVLD